MKYQIIIVLLSFTLLCDLHAQTKDVLSNFRCMASSNSFPKTMIDNFDSHKDQNGKLIFDGAYVYLFDDMGVVISSYYNSQFLNSYGQDSETLFKDLYQKMQRYNTVYAQDMAMITLIIDTNKDQVSKAYISSAIVNLSKELGGAFNLLEEKIERGFVGELSFADASLKLLIECTKN